MISQEEFDDWLKKDPAEIARRLFHDAKAVGLENVKLRKRLDPQLSEKAIQGNLSIVPSAENAEALQIGAMLTLVAIFDRKLDRELFVDTATAVTALYGMLGRLSIAESILHMMKKDVFTQVKVADAAKELITYAEVELQKIRKIMEQVEQCPTSYDTIN
jgi:uncharacterized protein with gpF-like domain